MDSERVKADRKQRVERLTVERWEKLPWLLPRATVLEWTGLDRRELSAEVAAGRLRVFRSSRPSAKGKYFKSEIARLAGIPTQQRIGPEVSGCVPIGPSHLDRRG